MPVGKNISGISKKNGINFYVGFYSPGKGGFRSMHWGSRFCRRKHYFDGYREKGRYPGLEHYKVKKGSCQPAASFFIKYPLFPL